MDMVATCSSFLGSVATAQMTATITESATLHHPEPGLVESVLMIFAPVSVWKPIIKILLSSKTMAVNSKAMREKPPALRANTRPPMSAMESWSGCRMQYFQSVSEV